MFETGDRVRVDIPNEDDIDFHLHGKHGIVKERLTDAAGKITGVDADAHVYRVEFDDGSIRDFRGRDIRPPLDE